MYVEEINFRNSYLIGFGTFDPGDLDLWPSDPMINWVPLLPSLRKVGQGVLELLIGNKKVTDGPTDMWKVRCPLYFEGGGITKHTALTTVSVIKDMAEIVYIKSTRQRFSIPCDNSHET